MTPFMLAVQSLIDGEPAPEPQTEDTADRAAGTHVVRSPLIRR
jgi:hypothetical protein